MSGNIHIKFNLDGQDYKIKLKESKATHTENKVRLGGVEYSIQGNSKEIAFIQGIFKQCTQDSTENLTQAGKDLQVKLTLAGAKHIQLSTAKGTHAIGLKCLANHEPFNIPETIKAVSLAMEQKYVFPEIGKKCGIYITEQLEAGAYDAITDLESFATALTSDIRLITEDKHIFVYLNDPPPPDIQILTNNEPITVSTLTPIDDPELKDAALYKASSDIGSYGVDPYEIKVGTLKNHPNVGYIDLTVFGLCKERDSTEAMKMDVAARRQAYMDTAAKLKNADPIIIDLRNNGGGDPSAVQLLCSFFIEEGEPLNRIEWRTAEGPKSQDFNTLTNEELPEEQRLLGKTIYILISPNTFSAAEEFSNNMQVHERAILIGQLTGGGAHPCHTFPIGDELTIQVPTGRAINPIREGNWEGVGIIPDLMVPQEQALDEVISLIQNKLT